MEQDRELKYARKKAAWILMHPATQYEIQSEAIDSILIYTGTDGGKPALMIAGIPVKSVSWLPEGIVIVTDQYEEPASLSFKSFYDSYLTATSSGTSIDFSGIKGLSYSFVPLADSTTTTVIPDSIKFDPSPSFKITGEFKASDLYWKPFSVGPGIPSKEKVHTYEENPSAWDDPIIEGAPDPKSLYGKALARAKRAKK